MRCARRGRRLAEVRPSNRLEPGPDDRRLRAGGTQPAGMGCRRGRRDRRLRHPHRPAGLSAARQRGRPARRPGPRDRRARLLALAEDHARSLGLSEIRLYTNEATTRTSPTTPGTGIPRPTGPSKTAFAGCSSLNPSTDHPTRGRSGYSPQGRRCITIRTAGLQPRVPCRPAARRSLDNRAQSRLDMVVPLEEIRCVRGRP
jgi:hypothetical protein